MKKSILAVCDPEMDYACNLMEAIVRSQGTAFEVQAFSGAKELIRFAGRQRVELLLISAAAMCDEIRELPIGRIMVLSDGEKKKELEEYPCIYKYQSSDQLIAEVMNYYVSEAAAPPLAMLKKRMEVIGIYSPVGRSGKTALALTLGQLLAKDRRVLYLNMEEYAGFESLMEEEYQVDLADLLYFARLGNGNLVYRLGSMIHRLGNLDYIPPFFSPEDLKSASPSEWEQLVQDLAEYSVYDVLILDIGGAVNGIFGLLRLCTRIFMPIQKDGVSKAKLDQYEKLLYQQNLADIPDRTRKLVLPDCGDYSGGRVEVGRLLWGALGDFARKLIREEFDERTGAGRSEASKAAPGEARPYPGGEGPGDLQTN